MKYVLFDDLGEIHIGPLLECKHIMIVWTKSNEAKLIYNRTKLREIANHFKNITDETSFSGFHLKLIEEKE
jgi:hypothetical protein